VDYAYADKYLLGATIRRDGVSVFYPGRQWGTFPSVSAGWRISQEDFLKGVSWLNDLKLRGSYGETGFTPTHKAQTLTIPITMALAVPITVLAVA